MYNFHYNFMIRKFKTRLLVTDTDRKNTWKKSTQKILSVQRII